MSSASRIESTFQANKELREWQRAIQKIFRAQRLQATRDDLEYTAWRCG